MTIGSNIASIRQRIADAERQHGRVTGSVKLLAVTKKHTADDIIAAYLAGQTAFGENYLQEALAKMSLLADKKIEWHFIGPIQSNKTRKIAEHFAWVQSVDSAKIAKRLNDQRPEHLPALNICIEVNISHEQSKSGIIIDEVAGLAAYCQTLPRLQLRGLMAIPKEAEQFEEQRKTFRQLNQLYQDLCAQGLPLDTLSMGMSEDFEAAIAEGATMVRIGTAIFGERV